MNHRKLNEYVRRGSMHVLFPLRTIYSEGYCSLIRCDQINKTTAKRSSQIYLRNVNKTKQKLLNNSEVINAEMRILIAWHTNGNIE